MNRPSDHGQPCQSSTESRTGLTRCHNANKVLFRCSESRWLLVWGFRLQFPRVPLIVHHKGKDPTLSPNPQGRFGNKLPQTFMHSFVFRYPVWAWWLSCVWKRQNSPYFGEMQNSLSIYIVSIHRIHHKEKSAFSDCSSFSSSTIQSNCHKCIL